MSWFTENVVPALSIIGGGAATVLGGPMGAAVGVPLMLGGMNAYGQADTNATNRQIASDATEANITSAREQMRFQEQMSNTAQVRGRQDAINAGYNPMLPAINSNQASSPSGAMGKAETTQVQNTLGQGLSSAIAVRGMMQEYENAGFQNALNKSLANKAVADANASTASAKESATRTAALTSQLGAISRQAKYDAEKAGKDLDFLPFDSWNQRAQAGLNSAKTLKDIVNMQDAFFRKSKKGIVINPETGEVLNEKVSPPPPPKLPSGNWNKNLDRYNPDYSNR